MSLLRLGYQRLTFSPPTPLFLILPPSLSLSLFPLLPLALLTVPFWWRKLPCWGSLWRRPQEEAEAFHPSAHEELRIAHGHTPGQKADRSSPSWVSRWDGSPIRHLTSSSVTARSWPAETGRWHVSFWGDVLHNREWIHITNTSQSDIWRPIWDFFLGIYMLTTKSSEDVPLDRNFKRVQTNHINVELNLFLKLLYPTFSAYSWETEALSLSQSPRDIREGPGPQPDLFLHLKCLQSFILTSFAI